MKAIKHICFCKRFDSGATPEYTERIYISHLPKETIQEIINDSNLVAQHGHVYFYSQVRKDTHTSAKPLEITSMFNTINQVCMDYLQSLPFGVKVFDNVIGTVYALYKNSTSKEFESIDDEHVEYAKKIAIQNYLKIYYR
jgi:hypothetical protein